MEPFSFLKTSVVILHLTAVSSLILAINVGENVYTSLHLTLASHQKILKICELPLPPNGTTCYCSIYYFSLFNCLAETTSQHLSALHIDRHKASGSTSYSSLN